MFGVDEWNALRKLFHVDITVRKPGSLLTRSYMCRVSTNCLECCGGDVLGRSCQFLHMLTGKTEDELPEQVISGFRVTLPDVTTFRTVAVESNDE